MKQTSDKIFRPLKIGSLKLGNNLIAAPMAGLSSLPYRLLAIEQGCALAISEMVSAEGVIRTQARTRRYFINDARARPFGLQIFGANPSSIADALKALEDEEIDLIDINMGCPVKKVCSGGAGAALMRTPKRAAEVIRAARFSTSRPLTVKIRSGWDAGSINCEEIAHAAEAEGADAVIVHPRTRQQFFKGRSDWKIIARVKAALKIPVIGNGDIKCRDDALRMMEETGCDGVMIGRATLGNPWIFRQMLDGDSSPPSRHDRGRTAIRHLDELSALIGERMALLSMRSTLPWYGKGISGVKKFLQRSHRARDIAELKSTIEEFFNGPTGSRT
ncbi:MAG: tRNA dihydrouridine synthase DusB [Pseudomonadota bacterium]